MSELRPQGEIALADSWCSSEVVARAIAAVGETPVLWGIEQGRRTAEKIITNIPPFDRGPAVTGFLYRGSEASTLHSLILLAAPRSEAAAVVGESFDGVGDYVVRAIPLDQVLRAIRIGHADLNHAFLHACREFVTAAEAPEEMAAVTDLLFRYVDALADRMTREYLAEYERWTTSIAAARLTLVRAVLDDDVPNVREASRALGYDLERRHLGVVVWTDRPSARHRLPEVADELLASRGATTTLTVLIDSGLLWGWGAVSSARQLTDDPVLPEGLHAAIGMPATATSGFRRTHAEAERIRRLRRLSDGSRPRISEYREVAPTILLASDLTAAGEFVRTELGALAGDGEGMRSLRATLLSYLTHERSLHRVADELHISRSTVAYRVKRAKELLGHDTGEGRFALHAALLLCQEVGAAALGSPDGGTATPDRADRRRA